MAQPLKVVMVCAHEPSLDPRIRWEAEAAARRFEVTVLGFSRPDGSCPPAEIHNGYKTIRLPQSETTGLYYFWRLKDVLPPSLLLPGAALALALLPALVVTEITLRLVYVAVRRSIGLARWLLNKSFVLSLALRLLRRRLGSIRGMRFARVHYIVSLLRLQFAPAASVFWNYFREASDKPDVIHCNDLDTLLIGILAKKNYRCRVVYDAHEFWPVSDSLCTWVDRTFFSLIERLLIRKADAVVTVNPLLAEEIRRVYSLKQVYSVPNVEPWIVDRPAAAKSAMTELSAGRVKFLFQGRFTVARGIEELIRAWAEVDSSRAALFLRGPDNIWRKEALDLAAQLGVLGKSVYFLDSVNEDQLVSAAAEADVGLIPYLPLALNERLCCPNKLSQYLHAGLMVVTNDLPYVRSVLDEASAGMHYSSGDLSTLVDVVHRIAADPPMLCQCKENARRFARDRFNWQAYGDIFLDLYGGVQDDRLSGIHMSPEPQTLGIISP
jgi:glycosyltransferase involved in cell wall biosynthesis